MFSNDVATSFSKRTSKERNNKALANAQLLWPATEEKLRAPSEVHVR